MPRAKRFAGKINQSIGASLSSPGQGAHPAVSAAAFAHLTNVGGGATMDARTLQIKEGGRSSDWMVGGEPSSSGRKVKEQVIGKGLSDPGISSNEVLQQVKRIRKSTGSPENVSVGSWKRTGSNVPAKKRGVVMDASRAFPNRQQAETEMLKRNEDAIFGLKNFEEVTNEQVRKERNLPARKSR